MNFLIIELFNRFLKVIRVVLGVNSKQNMKRYNSNHNIISSVNDISESSYKTLLTVDTLNYINST